MSADRLIAVHSSSPTVSNITEGLYAD